MEFRDDKLYVYLNDSLYILDKNKIISRKDCNLIKIFTDIESKMKLDILSNKIEYFDNKFFVICRDSKLKYYLIAYDLINKEILKAPIKFNAQDIAINEKEIIIISTKDNRVYLEIYNPLSNEITYDEIKEISELKLSDFEIDTFCKSIVYDKTISFCLSNNQNSISRKTYIFTLNNKNYKIDNFKEYTIDNEDYYLYGLNMFVK